MSWYTLQVSNHPDAGARLTNAEAGASWQTVYDGLIASAKDARQAVDALGKYYRHARAFRGKNVGRFFYAVIRATSARLTAPRKRSRPRRKTTRSPTAPCSSCP